MVSRYLLLLVASLLLAEEAARAQDLEWGIAVKEGYPVVDFGKKGKGRAKFVYQYTGTVSDTKYLEPTLFQYDCSSPADVPGVLQAHESVDADAHEYIVDVEVSLADLTESVHYVQTSASTADITFCVRVDYEYQKEKDVTKESINFRENKVTIHLTMTADFQIADVTLEGGDGGGEEEPKVEVLEAELLKADRKEHEEAEKKKDEEEGDL